MWATEWNDVVKLITLSKIKYNLYVQNHIVNRSNGARPFSPTINTHTHTSSKWQKVCHLLPLQVWLDSQFLQWVNPTGQHKDNPLCSQLGDSQVVAAAFLGNDTTSALLKPIPSWDHWGESYLYNDKPISHPEHIIYFSALGGFAGDVTCRHI